MAEVYSGQQIEWREISALGFVMDREDFVLYQKIRDSHPEVDQIRHHLQQEAKSDEIRGFSGALRVIFSEGVGELYRPQGALIPKDLESSLVSYKHYPINAALKLSNMGGCELVSFTV